MPKVSEITTKIEKRIDLEQFFGEEAFITIKRLHKYQFSYLLNRSRNGYTSKVYELMSKFKEENPDKVLSNEEYDKLRTSISVEESEHRISAEAENDRQYYIHSILPDKHNFTDDKGKLVQIDGEWFYNNYSTLQDKERNTLNSFLINEIIKFNNSGISLGE